MGLRIIVLRGFCKRRQFTSCTIFITICLLASFVFLQKHNNTPRTVSHKQRRTLIINQISTIKLLPPATDSNSFSSSKQKVNSSTYLKNYKSVDFTIKNELLCKSLTPTSKPKRKKKKLLVITVISARNNFYRRDIIRKTWGSKPSFDKWRIQVVFLLGESTTDNLQTQIEQENDISGDILLANFPDTYRNLVYKTLSGFKWITEYCNEASYILKTDDDVFIEIFQLIQHLTYLKDENTISCYIYHEAVPRRLRVNDTWYVPKEEYPGQFYPDYCPGTGYLISSDVVKAMYATSLTLAPEEIFWIEDVFVTGILRQHLIKKNIVTPDLLNFSNKYNVVSTANWKNWYRESKKGERLPWVFIQTWHESPDEFKHDFFSLWNKTLEFQHYLNKNNE